MKRGAKVCVLGFVGIFATALITFLLMHVALVTVTPPATTTQDSHHATDSRTLSSTTFLRRWMLRDGNTTTTVLGGPREQRTAFDAMEQAVMEAAAKPEHDADRSSDSSASTSPNASSRLGDCGVDRSFAPQCVGVSPKSWQLHRSVQGVGRMTIDNTDCSGVLLGSTTNAFFLTAARCLPWEGMAEHASIEFTNCIGSQVFTQAAIHYVNRQLDFVVLQLATRGFNVAGHYGFLHLRASGPTKEEVVFAPHYTDSYAKRITIINDEGLVRVRPSNKTTSDACTTTPSVAASRIQYNAARLDDVAVGAPVMSLTDYAVVALHVCGGCKTSGINTALSSKYIIDDLNATGHLLPAFLTKP